MMFHSDDRKDTNKETSPTHQIPDSCRTVESFNRNSLRHKSTFGPIEPPLRARVCWIVDQASKILYSSTAQHNFIITVRLH